MRNAMFIRHWTTVRFDALVFAVVTTMLGILLPIAALAQDKKDEVSFNLVVNPKFADCLRRSSYEVPSARATIIRGKQNTR